VLDQQGRGMDGWSGYRRGGEGTVGDRGQGHDGLQGTRLEGTAISDAGASAGDDPRARRTRKPRTPGPRLPASRIGGRAASIYPETGRDRERMSTLSISTLTWACEHQPAVSIPWPHVTGSNPVVHPWYRRLTSIQILGIGDLRVKGALAGGLDVNGSLLVHLGT